MGTFFLVNFKGWWERHGDEGEPPFGPPSAGDDGPADPDFEFAGDGLDGGKRGFLVLTGTRVLGWSVERSELAIDIYGGEGTWRAYEGLELRQQGTVDGMLMLTLRAGGRAALDLDLLARLTRWSTEGMELDVTVEVAGTELTAPGRRWTIGDREQTITLSSAR